MNKERKQLFTNIGKLVNDSRASSFEIRGYKYLDVIVKLIYDDCDEFYIGEYNEDFKLRRIGFSEDRDFDHIKWVKEWRELIPKTIELFKL
jgi:hypothetical protein